MDLLTSGSVPHVMLTSMVVMEPRLVVLGGVLGSDGERSLS